MDNRQLGEIERRLQGLEKEQRKAPETVLLIPVDNSNVSNPPTDAELDTIFGTVPEGFARIINDNGDGLNIYLVVYVGNAWWGA